MIFIVVFTYVPIFMSLNLSFRQWNFLSPDMPFVGLRNYEQLLSSSDLWNSLRVTVLFTVLSVPLRLALAVLAASYLVRESAQSRILRGALFLPAVTSTVSIGVVFSWVFATDYGMVNALLGHLGLGKVQWLQDPHLALWVLIFVNTWKQLVTTSSSTLPVSRLSHRIFTMPQPLTAESAFTCSGGLHCHL